MRFRVATNASLVAFCASVGLSVHYMQLRDFCGKKKKNSKRRKKSEILSCTMKGM